MILAAAFNPTLAMSGTFNAPTMQPGSKLIINNKSYVDLRFTFSNGDVRLVIANDRRAFTINVQSSVVIWEQENIDYPQTVNQLENIVYVEVYEPSETVIETYPSIIQRETLPSILPYNIGFGAPTFGPTTPSSGIHTIFPSSYVGISSAPSTVNGAAFDHFYLAYVPILSGVVIDIPGSYPATGKVNQNMTPVGTFSVLPGPFSLGGLTPIDDSTLFTNAYWQYPTTIPWASSTSGFLIDMWIIPQTIAAGHFQPLFGDGDGQTNGGSDMTITPTGQLNWSLQCATTSAIMTGGMLQSGWNYAAFLYTGTTTNTAQIWLNGTLVASANVAGAPVNSANNPRVGSNTTNGGSFTGQIANVGMQFTYSTHFMNQPANRWLMGQQSTHTDYQNAWLTGFDISTITAPTAFYTYSFTNMFQPSGLLYSENQSNYSPIHPVQRFGNGTLQYTIPTNASGYDRQIRFPQPITHQSIVFINFNDWVNTGPHYTLNVYGYNILGVA